ncbi:hypothetical protein [Novosphingobium sp.]|uniref:hypothetical protein n=1 Tax=Novosphingobium sp. TaxID=1874826 RepID=UPI003BA9739F
MAGLACLALALLALGAALALHPAPLKAQTVSDGGTARTHMGVASCAGSTCHGRSVASGTPIRQDELLRWQEESSPTGAHSRAWRVIGEPRGVAIARRLGSRPFNRQEMEALFLGKSGTPFKVSNAVDMSLWVGAKTAPQLMAVKVGSMKHR